MLVAGCGGIATQGAAVAAAEGPASRSSASIVELLCSERNSSGMASCPPSSVASTLSLSLYLRLLLLLYSFFFSGMFCSGTLVLSISSWSFFSPTSSPWGCVREAARAGSHEPASRFHCCTPMITGAVSADSESLVFPGRAGEGAEVIAVAATAAPPPRPAPTLGAADFCSFSCQLGRPQLPHTTSGASVSA